MKPIRSSCVNRGVAGELAFRVALVALVACLACAQSRVRPRDDYEMCLFMNQGACDEVCGPTFEVTYFDLCIGPTPPDLVADHDAFSACVDGCVTSTCPDGSSGSLRDCDCWRACLAERSAAYRQLFFDELQCAYDRVEGIC